MKFKASEWIRSVDDSVVSTMMRQLRDHAGHDVEINLTPGGIEIIQDGRQVDYLASTRKAILDLLEQNTAAVALVDDPYRQSEVAYIVIDIDPCRPVIREVPKGTENSFATLVDAKEAARQVLQAAMATAASSLSELRQVGIEKIRYITL